MKTLLLVIDMQNDFCDPSGSLYVTGAEKDAERLAAFISRKDAEISGMILTQDNHQVMDIAHPSFWVDRNGLHPEPYTVIHYQDIVSGRWIPVIEEEQARRYIAAVENSGEYSHTIWPEHCIWGSEGAAIHPMVMENIIRWARNGRFFEVVGKGTYPFSEHFGAFRANIPVHGVAETQFNDALMDKVAAYDKVWVAGEAKSHCVANTVRQLLDYPETAKKMVLLEDCMSNVAGCDMPASSIYTRAAEAGIVFSVSTAE